MALTDNITFRRLSKALTLFWGKIKASYQPKTDNALKTADKTIVGAINRHQDLFDELGRKMWYEADLGGYPLFRDPTFKGGLNGIGVYNNAGNGNVTHERVAKSTVPDAPTDSDFVLKISYKGPANPYCGGFMLRSSGRKNAVFVYKFIAKFPADKYIQCFSNYMGENTKWTWLTSVYGTGKFETYILRIQCDGNASWFADTGYFALVSASGDYQTPFDWYVAYANCYDMTREDSSIVVTKQVSNLATNVSELTTIATQAVETANSAKNSVTSANLHATQALTSSMEANKKSNFAIAPTITLREGKAVGVPLSDLKIKISHPLLQPDGTLPYGYWFVFMKISSKNLRERKRWTWYNSGQTPYSVQRLKRNSIVTRNSVIKYSDVIEWLWGYMTLFNASMNLTLNPISAQQAGQADFHGGVKYLPIAVAVARLNPDFAPPAPYNEAPGEYPYPYYKGVPKFIYSEFCRLRATRVGKNGSDFGLGLA